MEPIHDYLRRRLKEAGYARWKAMAAEISSNTDDPKRVTEHTLRHLANGERPNLGLIDVQLLLDYFEAVERGEASLPEPERQAA